MKGNPPFTRHEVTLDHLTRRSAGHTLELHHGEILLEEDRLQLIESEQAVWALLKCEKNVVAAARLLEKDTHVSTVRVTGKLPRLTLRTACLVGDYEIQVAYEPEPFPSLRATVRLTTKNPVKLINASREILLTDSRNKPLADGLAFTTQTGPTGGHAFVASGNSSVFYFQNLSALAAYSSVTEAKLESTVGVEWPEIGFRLPTGLKPIPAGTTLVISDMFIRVTAGSEGEAKRAREFVDGLAWAYRHVALPAGPWYDWPAAAARTVKSLSRSKTCLRRIAGVSYLNAYVGSDYKPPESMVQAAVRVPLVKYEAWLLKALPLARSLAGNLDPFFHRKLGTLARWLPGEKFLREEQSEEEEEERMDSWYLLHTMMNLGELAELGKTAERQLFLSSLDYVIKVARHFDHDWPVFYHRRTLAVFKRETQQGLGGERDVPGLYAHVMLQAWKLTADRKYLEEAENAAARLKDLGFGVLYQTNNTVYTAVALARLWKETGNGLYKDLSEVCIGSVLSHLWMWEPARPGHTWRTFMGLPPLHDAPYIAPYEEAEVFEAFRIYLLEMGQDIAPSFLEMLVEYGRHLLGRARFYLPEELPENSLCLQPKEGVVDRQLLIPAEDLYPSMDPAAQVGQEVYGAALPLILAMGSFHRWRKVPFLLWCEAPLHGATFEKRKAKGVLSFLVIGPEHHRYGLRTIALPHGRGKLRFKVRRRKVEGRVVPVRITKKARSHRCFDVPGGAIVEIEWQVS